MNPNDNNPMSPNAGGFGGADGSGVPGAEGASGSMAASPMGGMVDFTNPDNLNTTGGGLSANDSLASAEDSLTSAGQAAVAPAGAPELDELGRGDSSAIMDRPDQPLTPAAPVPGSIGSVTSVPPLPEKDETADTASEASGISGTNPFGIGTTGPGATSGASASPLNGAPAASSPAPAPVTSSNMPAMGGNANDAKPYFNPFAAPATPPAAPNANANAAKTAPTSSMNVPAALQPQTEKFSEKLKKPAGKVSMTNILMIVGWGVAIVAAILAVIFFMNWQDAEERAKKPKIIYIDQSTGNEVTPNPDEEDKPVEEPIALMTCEKNYGEEPVEGLENLVGRTQEMVVNYKGDAMTSIALFDNYAFVDEAAAEAAQWYFDDLKATQEAMATGLGLNLLSIKNERAGEMQEYSLGMNADEVVGDFIGTFMLNTGEDGTALTDKGSVQAAYEANGFSCTVE